jgi:hypothetical protein
MQKQRWRRRRHFGDTGHLWKQHLARVQSWPDTVNRFRFIVRLPLLGRTLIRSGGNLRWQVNADEADRLFGEIDAAVRDRVEQFRARTHIEA